MNAGASLSPARNLRGAGAFVALFSAMVFCAPSAMSQGAPAGAVSTEAPSANARETSRLSPIPAWGLPGWGMPGWGMMTHPFESTGSDPGVVGRPAGPWGMMRGRHPDFWGGLDAWSVPDSGVAALGLTDEQAQRIDQIHEEVRQKLWPVLGQMQTERFRLRQLHRVDRLDVAAIAEQQRKIDDIRRQVLRAHLDSRAQIEAVLNPEQRRLFRGMHSRWLLDD